METAFHMFQLIGGALAACTVVFALGDSLLAGIALALATFLWVLLARPSRRLVPMSALVSAPVSAPASMPVPWRAGYARMRAGT